jgi:ubiquinone/menaquinone biosynthesis C-methylase UbiE
MIPSQKDAWNDLYRSQSRPWKGVVTTKTSFPFLKGDKILDIGCGNGKTSLALMEEGYDVTGVDISEAAVEACIRLYGNRMRVICASVSSVPLNDREMDGAVMIHILEHLDNDELKASIKELHRVLRSNAKIFVRVFHKDDMRSDKGERIDENTVVRGNGIRYRYFDEDDLKNIFSGFHEISMISVNEITKFNENRSRIEAVFARPE